MTLRPGDIFGDYTVVRRLGKGGMGEVWLLKSDSGKQVAAKILDPESSADHESRKRFLRVAEALRRGENILAITLKGDGASYFDCGLTIETRSQAADSGQ